MLTLDDVARVSVKDLRLKARESGRVRWKLLPGYDVPWSLYGDSIVFRFPHGGVQQVPLVTKPLYNGGHRKFFAADGRRVDNLYLSPWEPWFVSKRFLQARGIRYRSWHLGRNKRRRKQIAKIESKYGYAFQVVRPLGVSNDRWERVRARYAHLTNPNISRDGQDEPTPAMRHEAY